jgi:hypothetical protein
LTPFDEMDRSISSNGVNRMLNFTSVRPVLWRAEGINT